MLGFFGIAIQPWILLPRYQFENMKTRRTKSSFTWHWYQFPPVEVRTRSAKPAREQPKYLQTVTKQKRENAAASTHNFKTHNGLKMARRELKSPLVKFCEQFLLLTWHFLHAQPGIPWEKPQIERLALKTIAEIPMMSEAQAYRNPQRNGNSCVFRWKPL
jgi:hypothetical protein